MILNMNSDSFHKNEIFSSNWTSLYIYPWISFDRDQFDQTRDQTTVAEVHKVTLGRWLFLVSSGHYMRICKFSFQFRRNLYLYR